MVDVIIIRDINYQLHLLRVCGAHNVGPLAPETSASGICINARWIASVRHDTSDVNEHTVVAADDACRSSPAGRGIPQSRASAIHPSVAGYRRDVTGIGTIAHASPIDDRFRIVSNHSDREPATAGFACREYLDRFTGWNIAVERPPNATSWRKYAVLGRNSQRWRMNRE